MLGGSDDLNGPSSLRTTKKSKKRKGKKGEEEDEEDNEELEKVWLSILRFLLNR